MPSSLQSSPLSLGGIYVPLVTPYYRGKFDPRSLKSLISFTSPHVNGYVPCLSSGEGNIISDGVWDDVVRCARRHTKKAIIAGIKREKIADMIKLSGVADDAGCDAVMIPVPYADEHKSLRYFRDLAKAISLPILVYNTENFRFKSLTAINELEENAAIVGMKDSSMNEKLFARMCSMRSEKSLRFPVFQGMEHQMKSPHGCDGHIVALANVEPQLVRQMLEKNSAHLNAKIVDLFWRYNLGGNWYVSLKAILAERKIIRSSEEAILAIRPQ